MVVVLLVGGGGGGGRGAGLHVVSLGQGNRGWIITNIISKFL